MSLEKISFNGKQISVCKAKTIYNLMRWGLYNPDVKDEEKPRYVGWFEKNRNQESINLNARGKPFMVPVNERGYLTMALRLELKTNGLLKSVRRYDEKYGHLNKPEPIKNVTFGSSDEIMKEVARTVNDYLVR